MNKCSKCGRKAKYKITIIDTTTREEFWCGECRKEYREGLGYCAESFFRIKTV